jgi:hypothetical protein
MPKPGIGRVVWYRSRTGKYTVPAIITATQESLYEGGVAAGMVPALSSDDHVHLTVFTPGMPGNRETADDFKVESPHGRGENVAGCYQEWDVPLATPGYEVLSDWAAPDDGADRQPPGTWSWPIITQPEVR